MGWLAGVAMGRDGDKCKYRGRQTVYRDSSHPRLGCIAPPFVAVRDRIPGTTALPTPRLPKRRPSPSKTKC